MRAKGLTILPSCMIVLLSSVAILAHAQTAQEIAKEAFGSTVLLVMEDGNGQPHSLGSGFVVRSGEIASNLHVVEGAARAMQSWSGRRQSTTSKALPPSIPNGIWLC